MHAPAITTRDSWMRCLALIGLLIATAAPAAAQAPDSEPGDAIDPAGAPVDGVPISLDDIAAHAADHAPRILAARAGAGDIAAAAAYAAPARRAARELSVGAGPVLGAAATGFSGTVGLMQELEVHGERTLRSEVATRWADEHAQALAEASWIVHAEVHGRYTDALAARRRWESLSTLVGFARSVRDVVIRRVDAGEDSDLDLALAEADLAAARQLQMDARADYVEALADLATATGWTREVLPTPIGEPAPPRPAPDLNALLAAAVEHRPDLRLQAQRLARLDAEVSLADQESRTDPAIGGEYEVDVVNGASDHRLLFVVEVGLGSEARRRSDSAGAEAERDRAGLEADAMAATALAEVRAAWRVLDSAWNRLRLYESDLLPRWESNLTLVQRAFEEGEIDLLGLLLAEERLLEQQMGAIEATRDYYAALAALELAAGTEVME